MDGYVVLAPVVCWCVLVGGVGGKVSVFDSQNARDEGERAVVTD
jgi:hypothetical protein